MARSLDVSSQTYRSKDIDDLRTLLYESSLAERKSFIKSFVKEVKVTGDEVLLAFSAAP